VLSIITDNGGEYVEADIFFKDKGIRHIRILPYSYQSNGVAERYNRTIQTMVRSMLLDLKPADNHLWAEACIAAVHIRNRLPYSQLKQRASSGDNTSTQEKTKTPFEMLFKKQPSISHLEPFGSHCYIYIPEEKRSPGSKLQPRAERAIFVGYSENLNIYKVQLVNKQMFTVQAKNCTFIQSLVQPLVQPLVQSIDHPLVQSQPVQAQLASVNESVNHLSSVASPNSTDQHIDHSTTLLATVLAVNECEPTMFKQATSYADAPRCITAMQTELKLMKEQNVWTVVPIPSNRNIVDCKWVYKIKKDSARQIT